MKGEKKMKKIGEIKNGARYCIYKSDDSIKVVKQWKEPTEHGLMDRRKQLAKVDDLRSALEIIYRMV